MIMAEVNHQENYHKIIIIIKILYNNKNKYKNN